MSKCALKVIEKVHCDSHAAYDECNGEDLIQECDVLFAENGEKRSQKNHARRRHSPLLLF
jgi:hypothetical protein